MHLINLYLTFYRGF